MDLKEFVDNLAELFYDAEPENITADTVFKELEDWESLTVLSIIAMVDTKYGVTITGKEIREAETIEDLYNQVKELKG